MCVCVCVCTGTPKKASRIFNISGVNYQDVLVVIAHIIALGFGTFFPSLRFKF